MGKKIYKTLIRNDHKLGHKKYVLGRIMGIAYMVSMDDNGTVIERPMEPREGGCMILTTCTSDQYEVFKRIISKLYPELCIFDYVDVLV